MLHVLDRTLSTYDLLSCSARCALLHTDRRCRAHGCVVLCSLICIVLLRRGVAARMLINCQDPDHEINSEIAS